jgi:hypothetical protein
MNAGSAGNVVENGLPASRTIARRRTLAVQSGQIQARDDATSCWVFVPETITDKMRLIANLKHRTNDGQG